MMHLHNPNPLLRSTSVDVERKRGLGYQVFDTFSTIITPPSGLVTPILKPTTDNIDIYYYAMLQLIIQRTITAYLTNTK